MTDNVFYELWQDLCVHYSHRDPGNVRIILSYSEEVKDLPDECIQALFTAVLKEHERFPSLKSFSEICQRFKPKNANRSVQNEVYCHYCRNDGVIIVDRINAYACPKCPRGGHFLRQGFMSYEKRFGVAATEKLYRDNTTPPTQTTEEMKANFFRLMEKWALKQEAWLNR